MRGLYFILFKSAVELINTKKHLTIEGLIEFVSIRAAIKLGLTETLIASFTYISHKYRAIKYKNINIPSPYWSARQDSLNQKVAFCCLSVPKSKSYQVGYKTQLFFSVVLACATNEMKNYFNLF
jgi:hypothetical protein